ncbi:ISAs1 family transposase [Actinomadura coerulea]|uniref:ISAs1 family transposase n=1 Tax=Actinomadura coerulea TaxID=46159 RepID=UPI003424E287
MATTPGEALDKVDGDTLGAWLETLTRDAAGRPVLSGLTVDGKTVRGAKNATGKAPHLVDAVRHDTGVVAQRQVPAKSNETKAFAPLLGGVELMDTIVTCDAMQTSRANAEYVHARGGFYLFPVKGNQPKLFAALVALPRQTAPIAHRQTSTARGRTESRTLQVLPVPPSVDFPHAIQALADRTDHHGPRRQPGPPQCRSRRHQCTRRPCRPHRSGRIHPTPLVGRGRPPDP